ncbi:hypothetical protein GOODEAATRI_010364 [Goodea atripinnis]|uniref:Uncharacterized protein n=1 Tax=Goodea atripinnis TaxID=208336 RepID=A0ABV0PCY5_9TELE
MYPYLHVAHDELEQPSQGAAFLLYTRIHFSTRTRKNPPQPPNTKLFFYLFQSKTHIKTLSVFLPLQQSHRVILTQQRRVGCNPQEAKSSFKRNGLKKGGKVPTLSLGCSQPMLPAGQLDKRPAEPRIMTESSNRLSGNACQGFSG